MIPKAKPVVVREVDMWEILAISMSWLRAFAGDLYQAFSGCKRYTPTFARRKDETWLQLRPSARLDKNRAGASSESIGSNRRQSKYQECGDGESIGEAAGKHIKDASGF